MARLLRYLLALAAAFVMLQYFASQSRAQAMMDEMDDVDDEDVTGYGEWILGKPESAFEPEHGRFHAKDPEFRVEFGRGPGGLVKGWPSKGGVYVLRRCFGVELEFLGVDRFHNTPRPSILDPTAAADEEGMHCNKMRRLGATWWENEYDFFKSVIGEPELTDTALAVGWPAGGGVWVLLPESPMRARIKGFATIHNAYNMEERCKAIEQLGGVFYKNPKDCPFLDLP